MSKIKGRDIASPVKTITIEDVPHPLVFNNQSARLAEDVYEDQYKRDQNYAEILQDLSRGKYRAVMAVFYGAMVAGGADISWAEFDEKFKLDSIPGIKETIMAGVVQSLPEPDDEDETKNA